MSKQDKIDQKKENREMIELAYRLSELPKKFRMTGPGRDYRYLRISIQDVNSGEQWQSIYTYFKDESMRQLWDAVYKASTPDDFLSGIAKIEKAITENIVHA